MNRLVQNKKKRASKTVILDTLFFTTYIDDHILIMLGIELSYKPGPNWGHLSHGW